MKTRPVRPSASHPHRPSRSDSSRSDSSRSRVTPAQAPAELHRQNQLDVSVGSRDVPSDAGLIVSIGNPGEITPGWVQAARNDGRQVFRLEFSPSSSMSVASRVLTREMVQPVFEALKVAHSGSVELGQPIRVHFHCGEGTCRSPSLALAALHLNNPDADESRLIRQLMILAPKLEALNTRALRVITRTWNTFPGYELHEAARAVGVATW